MQPMRIVAPYQKNHASKAKFAEKKNLFLRRFYTLYKQKFSYLRPLFPKDSENIKHLDIGPRKVGQKDV